MSRGPLPRLQLFPLEISGKYNRSIFCLDRRHLVGFEFTKQLTCSRV